MRRAHSWLSLLILFCSMHLPAYSQVDTTILGFIPQPKEAVSINNFSLAGTLHPGDTAYLAVNYTSHLNGTGRIRIDFPKYIVPLDQQLNEKYRIVSVPMDSGQSRQFLMPVKVLREGCSHISVATYFLNSPPVYNRSVSRFANVETSNSSYKVTYDNELYSKQIQLDTLPLAGPTPNLQHFIVNGNVRYYNDKWDREVGLKNARVRLAFINKTTKNMWIPPLGSGENARHKHYDICDDQGNFFFDYTVIQDHTILENNYDLGLLVERSNDAVSIVSGGGEYVIELTSGKLVTFTGSEGAILPIEPMGLGSSFTYTYNNIGITINSKDGALFASSVYSREFVTERYSGTIPFDLRPITIERYPNVYVNGNPVAGVTRCKYNRFTGEKFVVIQIDDDFARSYVVNHEYGHFVLYSMWDRDCERLADAPTQIKEGWAIFFSFASRSYANNRHGADLEESFDNTEVANFLNPRFLGMSYSTAHPEYCAFASYLWNLYDSYSDLNFMPTVYNDYNNDDVNGLGKKVFETLRTCNSNTITPFIFNYLLQDNLPVEQQASIDYVYSSIIGNTYLMRPAQIKDVVFFVHEKSADFFWTPRSYSSNAYYGNYEDGYKIYRSSNNEWILVGTVPFGVNYASITGGCGLFKLTSYNASGEAFPPVYIHTLCKSAAEESLLGNQNSISLTIAPNPLYETALIEYSLPVASLVTMEIYDKLGRKLVGVEQQMPRNSGVHNTRLDAGGLQNGVYFLRMTAVAADGQLIYKTISFTVKR